MSTPTELLLEGYRLQSQGRFEDAERQYRAVLEAEALNVHALNLLGIVCLETGRAKEAVEWISRAVEQTPGDAEALANLGVALKDVGRLTEAAEVIHRSLTVNRRNPVGYNNLGNILSELGRDHEAVDAFRSAVKLDPGYAACLANLAAALLKLRQINPALAAAQRSVELNPRLAEGFNRLGEVHMRMARHAEAATDFRTAISLRPDYFDAMINLSSALKETGDIDAGEAVLRDVISKGPSSALARNSLGVFLEQKGDVAGAAAQFRAAIAEAPAYASPHYQLAQLKGVELSPAEIAAVEELYERAEPGGDDKAPLAFALACIRERQKSYDEAFHLWSVGQGIKARAYPYDDRKVEQFYGRIATAFSSPFGGHVDAPTGDGPRPMFVLGMPRSGTTLAEQVLVSHPEIAGVGEVSLMEDTVNEAVRLAALEFPECVARLSAKDLRYLGEYYRSRLRTRAPGSYAFIVDKTPMNFQYVGFIAAILPDAAIIHCRRHPMDNCLSIFKLPFEESHSYSHSLEALGQYYSRYAGLMDHWRLLFGDRIIELNYEDQVADLELGTRRLLCQLGLKFHDAVLQFHTTQRLIKTPSASQVRQPIYRDSVSAWRRYERQLAPLAAAFAPPIRSVL